MEFLTYYLCYFWINYIYTYIFFFAKGNILFGYRLQSLISHTLGAWKQLIAYHCNKCLPPKDRYSYILKGKFNSDILYKKKYKSNNAQNKGSKRKHKIFSPSRMLSLEHCTSWFQLWYMYVLNLLKALYLPVSQCSCQYLCTYLVPFILCTISTKVVLLPRLLLIFTCLTLLLNFKKVNIAFVTLSWVMHFPSQYVIILKAVQEAVFLF